MKLKRHTACGEYIDFEPAQGTWKACNSGGPFAINGTGDLVGDSCVALVRHGDGLEVYIGAARFDVEDAQFAAGCRENGERESIFWARDSHGSGEVVYPCWWVGQGALQIANGPADEEMDVCAYIADMLSEPSVRPHLIGDFVSREADGAAARVASAAAGDITYYQRIPDSFTRPSTVFRFYRDPGRLPERYSVSEGWVADRDVYLRLMSGVIDEDDIVSEAQARQIVKDLGGAVF